MKTKTLRQSVVFKASPHDVYELLMDSKKHGELTGSTAKISREVEGKFSIYRGEVEGSNLVLVQDRKIVQAWRYAMEGWPEGHFSKAIFSIHKLNGKTKLSFVQTGVPAECADSIAEGWKEYYWKPMKKMLEKEG